MNVWDINEQAFAKLNIPLHGSKYMCLQAEYEDDYVSVRVDEFAIATITNKATKRSMWFDMSSEVLDFDKAKELINEISSSK